MIRTPVGTKATIVFIVVTTLLDVVAMGIVIPVLPALIEQFIGSNAQAGLINGLFVALWAFMQFLAAPVIGAMSDRFGRRPVLLISTAGLAFAYVTMALAPNLWWLALGRMIVGATSASFATAHAYMADVTPSGERARAYGLLGAAFSGGIIAGPLLGGALSELSPRAPFWSAGVLSILAVLYGFFVLPESLSIDRRMAFSWKRANPFGALQLLRSTRELTRLALVNALVYFALYVIPAVLVLYVSHRYLWSPSSVGILLALIGVADMIVQGALVGRVSRYLGDRGTMIFGLFTGAAGLACLGLAPTGPLFALAVIPTALRCLAIPTLQSLMTRCVSESEQGQLQGANMSLASIAGIVAPPFFGAVYSMSLRSTSDLSYSGSAFVLSAVVLAMGGISSLHIAHGTKHRRKSPIALTTSPPFGQ